MHCPGARRTGKHFCARQIGAVVLGWARHNICWRTPYTQEKATGTSSDSSSHLALSWRVSLRWHVCMPDTTTCSLQAWFLFATCRRFAIAIRAISRHWRTLPTPPPPHSYTLSGPLRRRHTVRHACREGIQAIDLLPGRSFRRAARGALAYTIKTALGAPYRRTLMTTRLYLDGQRERWW